MDTITITKNGLSVISFNELRNQIADQWIDSFSDSGLDKINLESDTPDGHHIDLEAKTIITLAQTLQAIVANLNRDTATGLWLENIASLYGLQRNVDEKDSELRKRLESAFIGGFATYDGMLTYLRDNISNAVTIDVNDEPETVNGLPGHSVTLYVPENLVETEEQKNAIAKLLWKCKPAGIRTFGNTTGTAVDLAGVKHDLLFAVIAKRQLFIKISVKEYDEEILPKDYKSLIKNAVVDWSKKEYTNGKDIFPQRILTPVYSVSGIGEVEILCRFGDAGDFTNERIFIENSVFASVAEENIEVTKL